jgi:hypothetical protein
MSDVLVAYFHSQLEAVNAAKELLMHGIQRDDLKLHVADRAETKCHGRHLVVINAAADGSQVPVVRANGITLSVVVKDGTNGDDLRALLAVMGAYFMDVPTRNAAQASPDAWSVEVSSRGIDPEATRNR